VRIPSASHRGKVASCSGIGLRSTGAPCRGQRTRFAALAAVLARIMSFIARRGSPGVGCRPTSSSRLTRRSRTSTASWKEGRLGGDQRCRAASCGPPDVSDDSKPARSEQDLRLELMNTLLKIRIASSTPWRRCTWRWSGRTRSSTYAWRPLGTPSRAMSATTKGDVHQSSDRSSDFDGHSRCRPGPAAPVAAV